MAQVIDTVHMNRGTEAAVEYYASDDTHNFYYHIWGNEDIHVGKYDRPDMTIREASDNIVHNMMELVKDHAKPEWVVADLGAGLGGSMRKFCQRYGCKAKCINIAEAQNTVNTAKCKETGMDDLIDVIHG